MSVTRPTLIDFFDEAAVVDEPLDDDDFLSSLLEPQAAAKRSMAAMAIATIARRDERAGTSWTPSRRWIVSGLRGPLAAGPPYPAGRRSRSGPMTSGPAKAASSAVSVIARRSAGEHPIRSWASAYSRPMLVPK